MSKRFFDFDPLTGSVQTFEYDEDGDKVMIHQTTDVTKALDLNKAEQNVSTGWNDDKTMRHAARIPQAVCDLWMQIYGVNVLDQNHWPKVKQLLNSSEWMWLRTANWQL